MTLEHSIRAIAAVFVLLSLGLGYWVSPYWHLFTAFVGVNLLQSAFTGWCPMEAFLTRLGVPPVSAPPGEGVTGRPLAPKPPTEFLP